MKTKTKILFVIALLLLSPLLWKIAKTDMCPTYYHIKCLK